MPEKKPKSFLVPESELEFQRSRSSGAGGQNVNKVETKVTVRWNFKKSPSLTDWQKSLIENNPMLKNRINENGELIVHSQAGRSQNQNRKKAIEILRNLVHSALTPPPKRKKTKIPRKEREKRIENKKIVSQKKKLRGKVF